MSRSSRHLIVCAWALMLCGRVLALEAGWRTITIDGVAADGPAATVALYYPTQAAPRSIAMGPYNLAVAIQAPPEPKFKALIVLSHGTGGSELAHSSLAQALARSGYLVAALRHPGDNWTDKSLMEKTPERYFAERPRQLSQVIDALLRDPQWKDHITSDTLGPRVGAVGHSAGGYSVLALAGGQPDLARLVKHCASEAAGDPIFCATGRSSPPAGAASAAMPAAPDLSDRRVRAIVSMAPAAAVFSANSLAKITVPVLLYGAELDRWLVPRFHAEWVAANVPGIEFRRVTNAWHFAFMDAPAMPIPTLDGDARADPPGFDRAAFLAQLAIDVPAFFDKVFR